MSFFKNICCPFLLILFTSSFSSVFAAELSINFNNKTGKINPLSGVQGSPFPIVEYDLERVEQFRDSHISLVRFPQDCYPNTLTLGGIFPDAAADAELPESYNFKGIDQHIKAAASAGCDILWQASYDIGESDSWHDINLGGRAPVDMKKWCRVVKKCLMHFNNGWAGGYNYTVKFVEFINEPGGLGGFRGDNAKKIPQAFMAFIEAIEEYNRENPSTPVKAVGPGLPFSIAEWPARKQQIQNAIELFRRKGVKLPIFSFHTYGGDTSPIGTALLGKAYRNVLDEAGFSDTQLWNTEWQGGDFLAKEFDLDLQKLALTASSEDVEKYKRALATYALSCKIRWQGIIDGSCYYRANKRAHAPRFTPKSPFYTSFDSPFFLADGSPTPLARQEALMYRIAAETPYRCQINSDSPNQLITAMACRSSDGSTLNILVCNLSNAAENFRLTCSMPVADRYNAFVTGLKNLSSNSPAEGLVQKLDNNQVIITLNIDQLNSTLVTLKQKVTK